MSTLLHPITRGWASLGLAFLLLTPAWSVPGKSGLDLQNLDPGTAPQQDFFQYANGGWLKSHPIPEDKPRWGTFNQLLENNQEKLHDILLHTENPKLRNFFRSGMNPQALQAGVAQIKADYAAIGQAKAVQPWVEKLHARGTRVYFAFGSTQDARDSSLVTGQLSQGGLGMPDRDYYFRKDEKSEKLRRQYRQLIAAAFARLGDPQPLAQKKAEQVFALEKKLAEASMTLVEQRDPEATYHPVDVSKLSGQAPGWNWPQYFQALHTPPMQRVNVAMPKFFARLGQLLKQVPLEQQRAYLQWHLIRTAAEYLTEDWAELHYSFYGKALTGAQAQPPRWRRVVKVIDSDMGDALGREYVEKCFPPEAKAKVEDMVHRLRQALSVTLNGLEWMSPETKQAAQAKLAAFHAKIGYPEHWRDYSALKIEPGNYLGNVRRALAFEVQRDLRKIGQPVDKNEWYMTPPTVNAYYDPQNNEIVFPAGILQPPFFSLEADDAVNYGALGTVIGHEITHGFDDQGAQFDPQGNLRNWWTDEDLKKFKGLATAIEDQFSGYEVAPGLHINGKLVVGESIADLGGLKLALMAYHDSQQGKTPETIDGFTPEQRFFLGYARIWAMNMRPEYEQLQVNTDPHPHPRFRVNGPLSNLPEFQQAFGIPDNSPMVRKQRNRVW